MAGYIAIMVQLHLTNGSWNHRSPTTLMSRPMRQTPGQMLTTGTLDNLFCSLHGDRMRELRQRDVELRTAFETDQEAAMDKLRAEVLDLMVAFGRAADVGELYHPYIWAREFAMWELHM
ncbi:hypothetical protein B0H14DRAFT_3458800 [Mycena olivaceomarginata]|nr:hypothetical protein B0H14DRAFT_3458800 [Mycena olivaceomarginata]